MDILSSYIKLSQPAIKRYY
ncbi:uncharacterized protein FTOL_13858 [Fusarium torulosum]|uniref:Uncharacterized protein n=1 Tax=Fusarium torulosum TaxID=33205 RepID=A0AAE8MMU7_9HYPO|nr:uncharacterized protein FTOL_13858 [Fusarium torulosum]